MFDKLKYKLFLKGIDLFLWFVCWFMAYDACRQLGVVDRLTIKYMHTQTLHYKVIFWQYMNDEITKEKHDQYLKSWRGLIP